MRKFLIIPCIAIISFSCHKTDKKEVQRMRQALPVNGIIVKPKVLEHSISATGTILANEEVDLRPEVSGRVVAINFNEGQKVKKGDLLLKINDSELVAQLQKTELQVQLAQADENRAKALLNEKGISRQEYDIALNKLQTLQADAAYLKAQIAKTSIVAPFSGTLGLRQISKGAYVSASTPVAMLVQTDTVKIEFSVPERYATYVKPGTIIKITNNAEKKFQATVYATEQKIDVGTRTLKVRARCNNANRELIAGSFVKIEIVLEKINNALMVPSETVVPVLAGQIVYLYKNNQANAVQIIPGIRTDTEVQVLKGIEPGDTLITTGIMMLRDGMPVKLNKL